MIIMIEETVVQTFNVDSDNFEEAIKIARKKYGNGEFVVDNGNCTFVQISAQSKSGEFSEWEEL